MNDENDNDLVQRTTEFALRVVRMFVSLPKTDEARVLGKQVLRSGTSVGANYLGIHRMYIGKIGTGILWLLTGGLFGFGWLYDFCTLNSQVDERNRNSKY